jgi:glycerol-1-phosphate dehydrogenase [NAD(P)+]
VSSISTLSDPTDLAALRVALGAADPQGRLVPLGLGRVVISPDAVDTVVDTVAAELTRTGRPAVGPVVMLVDATPIARAGLDLKAEVESLLGARFDVRRAVLRGPHSTLHVDDEALDAATAAVRDAGCVVSVGGGTITDIAKVATARVGHPPLVVLQTAASVDGYTDNVSVVLVDGVKRTVPSRWPDVVLADVTTIAQAPDVLNTSGYGEVLSMFTAPADWYLASALGLDDSFHRAPRDLLVTFGRNIAQWSPGVSRREPDAVRELTRMLAIRGVATGVAGTTACLSGVEHLVSHMLDMFHGERGEPIGLHGAQVGVASVLAAAAWEHLLARFDPAAVDLDALFGAESGNSTQRPRVLAAFAELDPSGRLGEECWRDYGAKLARWHAARPVVTAALADWDTHRAALDELLVDSRTLGAGLRAAGAAATFAELEPVVDDATARWAVAHCHLMRARFTVVDLLDLLGWWTAEDQAAVFAAAAAAVDTPTDDTDAVGTTDTAAEVAR